MSENTFPNAASSTEKVTNLKTETPQQKSTAEPQDLPGEKSNFASVDDLQCGYVVGLKDDGEFVFDIIGKEPGLVQLLGLHQYANHRLMFAKDVNQGYGFPVVMKQLSQLGQMLQVLLNMSTQQSKSTIDLSKKK